MTEFVDLKHYDLEPEALLDCQLLEKAGIEVRIEYGNGGAFRSHLVNGPVTLFVKAEELPHAQDIIAGNEWD